MGPTKISVVIPTLNAAEKLEELLKKLWLQEQKVDQIVVIDSGSKDKTVELALSNGVQVVVIDPDAFDHGITRNLAVDHALGDIIVFMTQDALPVDSELIGNLIKPLKEPDIVVSYARQVPLATASPQEQHLRLTNYPPSSSVKAKEDIAVLGIKTFQSSNVCAAYWRREFDLLGRFPQPVVCNEDMLFAARAIFAGYKIAYTAEAQVWHSHCLSSKMLFKRYFDIAASLDHEPQIRNLGMAESKGLDFIKAQLAFIKGQKKMYLMPKVLLESGAKYAGYKAGENHRLIPSHLKKYLGSNALYWAKVEVSK